MLKYFLWYTSQNTEDLDIDGLPHFGSRSAAMVARERRGKSRVLFPLKQIKFSASTHAAIAQAARGEGVGFLPTAAPRGIRLFQRAGQLGPGHPSGVRP